MKQVLVYGAGGFAREVAWLATQCGYAVAGFIDDDLTRAGQELNRIPIKSLDQAMAVDGVRAFVVGIGSPKTREKVAERAIAAGLEPVSLIHPRIERSEFVTVGSGTVICAGNILTTNITLGRHVQINLDCTIGHDVVMEDYATLAPGVHVSGWVRLEAGSYVGTGATIINGTSSSPLVIGAGATIGAGACVTKSVPAGVTAVGVPAKAR